MEGYLGSSKDVFRGGEKKGFLAGDLTIPFSAIPT